MTAPQPVAQPILSVCNASSGFRPRASKRLGINPQNLRVIDANKNNPENTTSVVISRRKVKYLKKKKTLRQITTIKKCDSDLDEISDSPFDEAIIVESLDEVSDDPLDISDDDNKQKMMRSSKKSDKKNKFHIGYRISKPKYLPYKPLHFFKPKFYYFSERLYITCLNVKHTVSETGDDQEADSISPDLAAQDSDCYIIEEEESQNATKRKQKGGHDTNKVSANTSLVKSTERTSFNKAPNKSFFRGKSMIQDEIDSCVKPLIGLEYAVEIWFKIHSTFWKCACLLCKKIVKRKFIIDHISGIPHQVTYLDKHFPEYCKFFNQTALRSMRRNRKELLRKICTEIDKVGRQNLFITSRSYFQKKWDKIDEAANSSFHVQADNFKINDNIIKEGLTAEEWELSLIKSKQMISDSSLGSKIKPVIILEKVNPENENLLDVEIDENMVVVDVCDSGDVKSEHDESSVDTRYNKSNVPALFAKSNITENTDVVTANVECNSAETSVNVNNEVEKSNVAKCDVSENSVVAENKSGKTENGEQINQSAEVDDCKTKKMDTCAEKLNITQNTSIESKIKNELKNDENKVSSTNTNDVSKTSNVAADNALERMNSGSKSSNIVSIDTLCGNRIIPKIIPDRYNRRRFKKKNQYTRNFCTSNFSYFQKKQVLKFINTDKENERVLTVCGRKEETNADAQKLKVDAPIISANSVKEDKFEEPSKMQDYTELLKESKKYDFAVKEKETQCAEILDVSAKDIEKSHVKKHKQTKHVCSHMHRSCKAHGKHKDISSKKRIRKQRKFSGISSPIQDNLVSDYDNLSNIVEDVSIVKVIKNEPKISVHQKDMVDETKVKQATKKCGHKAKKTPSHMPLNKKTVDHDEQKLGSASSRQLNDKNSSAKRHTISSTNKLKEDTTRRKISLQSKDHIDKETQKKLPGSPVDKTSRLKSPVIERSHSSSAKRHSEGSNRRRFRSPVRKFSKSPIRKHSKSPLKKFSKSPTRKRLSPYRRYSRSPRSRSSRSPLRRHARSPRRKSPFRRHARRPSYDRSPQRRYSRSPHRENLRSPLHEEHNFRRSSRGRERSRSLSRHSRRKSESPSQYESRNRAKRPRYDSYERPLSSDRYLLKSPLRSRSPSFENRSRYANRTHSTSKSRSRSRLRDERSWQSNFSEEKLPYSKHTEIPISFAQGQNVNKYSLQVPNSNKEYKRHINELESFNDGNSLQSNTDRVLLSFLGMNAPFNTIDSSKEAVWNPLKLQSTNISGFPAQISNRHIFSPQQQFVSNVPKGELFPITGKNTLPNTGSYITGQNMCSMGREYSEPLETKQAPVFSSAPSSTKTKMDISVNSALSKVYEKLEQQAAVFGSDKKKVFQDMRETVSKLFGSVGDHKLKSSLPDFSDCNKPESGFRAFCDQNRLMTSNLELKRNHNLSESETVLNQNLISHNNPRIPYSESFMNNLTSNSNAPYKFQDFSTTPRSSFSASSVPFQSSQFQGSFAFANKEQRDFAFTRGTMQNINRMHFPVDNKNMNKPIQFKPGSNVEATRADVYVGDVQTLAQRLASVLVKLGMVDVPGPLLSEMLRKIGDFSRYASHDLSESEIGIVLKNCGYIR